MLIATSTKYAAGVRLVGDYLDLVNVHDTIGVLSYRNHVSPEIQEFLAGLNYEIRKAYDGMRDVQYFDQYDDAPTKYFGFQYLWPNYLVCLGILRWSAGFGPTTRDQQSCLYRLEASAETALGMIDADVGHRCMDWLDNFDMFSSLYITDFIWEISLRYVTETQPGKRRLRELPRFLDLLSPFSTEYSEFEKGYRKDLFKKWNGLDSASSWSDPNPEFKW